MQTCFCSCNEFKPNLFNKKICSNCQHDHTKEASDLKQRTKQEEHPEAYKQEEEGYGEVQEQEDGYGEEQEEGYEEEQEEGYGEEQEEGYGEEQEEGYGEEQEEGYGEEQEEGYGEEQEEGYEEELPQDEEPDKDQIDDLEEADLHPGVLCTHWRSVVTPDGLDHQMLDDVLWSCCLRGESSTGCTKTTLSFTVHKKCRHCGKFMLPDEAKHEDMFKKSCSYHEKAIVGSIEENEWRWLCCGHLVIKQPAIKQMHESGCKKGRHILIDPHPNIIDEDDDEEDYDLEQNDEEEDDQAAARKAALDQEIDMILGNIQKETAEQKKREAKKKGKRKPDVDKSKINKFKLAALKLREMNRNKRTQKQKSLADHKPEKSSKRDIKVIGSSNVSKSKTSSQANKNSKLSSKKPEKQRKDDKIHVANHDKTVKSTKKRHSEKKKPPSKEVSKPKKHVTDRETETAPIKPKKSEDLHYAPRSVQIKSKKESRGEHEEKHHDRTKPKKNSEATSPHHQRRNTVQPIDGPQSLRSSHRQKRDKAHGVHLESNLDTEKRTKSKIDFKADSSKKNQVEAGNKVTSSRKSHHSDKKAPLERSISAAKNAKLEKKDSLKRSKSETMKKKNVNVNKTKR